MRSRILRPDFWSDLELARLPHGARLLYIGLWTMADREGRLIDSPVQIAGLIFPHDGQEILDDVIRWLHELIAGGWLVRYEARGGRFLWIRNFTRYQKPHPNEPASRIPPPPQELAADRRDDPLTAMEPKDPFLIQEIARRIHERHPAHRRGGLHQTEQALCGVLNGALHAAEIAARIDAAHAVWCDSEEWRRQRGRFVPRLERWISEHGWESMPAEQHDEIF